MEMNKEQERLVVDSCIKFLGEGGKFQGEFTPTQQQNVCNNPDHNHNIEQVPQPRDKYNFNMDNLLADTSPKDGSRKERRAAERAERKEQKKL